MADCERDAPRAQPTVVANGGDAERLAERKSLLRGRLRAARARLGPAERACAGRALMDAVLGLPQAQMAGTIAAYVSVGSEPPSGGLVFALWKRGGYVLLPVLRDDYDLDWASYEGPDSLVPGPRGLLEPAAQRRGTGAISRADLVVVPALAVDRAGNRLGRGGGSYDRALARVGPSVPTIALLYDDELLDEVPAGPHDQRVRAVGQPQRGIIWVGLPLLPWAVSSWRWRVLRLLGAFGRTCADVRVRLHRVRRPARGCAALQRRAAVRVHELRRQASQGVLPGWHRVQGVRFLPHGFAQRFRAVRRQRQVRG